uniref:Reticulocyte-binding protein 2 like a n=3 Tax=Talaromyces marneffei PM1 TaxID=1077442 RepID=A0A093VTZ3_TALMA
MGKRPLTRTTSASSPRPSCPGGRQKPGPPPKRSFIPSTGDPVDHGRRASRDPKEDNTYFGDMLPDDGAAQDAGYEADVEIVRPYAVEEPDEETDVTPTSVATPKLLDSTEQWQRELLSSLRGLYCDSDSTDTPPLVRHKRGRKRKPDTSITSYQNDQNTQQPVKDWSVDVDMGRGSTFLSPKRRRQKSTRSREDIKISHSSHLASEHSSTVSSSVDLSTGTHENERRNLPEQHAGQERLRVAAESVNAIPKLKYGRMFLTFSKKAPLRLQITQQYVIMPTRTSTRQAAVKANKAFNQSAGIKRRGSSSSQLPSKKGKKDVKPNEGNGYQKPTVTEEAQEIKPSEDPTKVQTTVNMQPTEAPPEKSVEPAQEGGVKEDKEKEEKEKEEKEKEEKEKEEKEKEEKEKEEKEEKEKEEKEKEEKEKEKEEKKELEKLADGIPAGKEEEKEEKPATKEAQTAIKISPEREDVLPSSILEKGIVYFFFRPRVNVEDPHSISDVARSFFVLQPTPKGAKIEDGPIRDDTANCRLLILPKKRYPASGRERDMGFVEKAKVTLKTIRESLMTPTTYETKTYGERTRPEARPYAEGVYALIKEGRNSHLAYILTIPRQLGDVQSDFGIHGRGSFIIQSKNPEYPGPPIAQLPKGPEYPEQVQEKFKGYRWIPTEPEFLDYPNAQFLMIGEAHGHLGKAGEAHIDDQGTKEDPAQELDQLEEENEERVDSLSGDHSIFEDLGAEAKKHESVTSEWE